MNPGLPIASRHIAEIGYDMAKALEYINARTVLHRDIKRMTAQGENTGTATEFSPASDLYSLGLVLSQSFTRAIEFPGSMVESAMARLSRDPVIPQLLPPHWRDVLSAVTARDPAHRPTALARKIPRATPSTHGPTTLGWTVRDPRHDPG